MAGSVWGELRRVWLRLLVLSGLWGCFSVGALGQVGLPDTSVTVALRNLASRAGVAFAGQVMQVSRVGGVVEIVFRVERVAYGYAGWCCGGRSWSDVEWWSGLGGWGFAGGYGCGGGCECCGADDGAWGWDFWRGDGVRLEYGLCECGGVWGGCFAVEGWGAERSGAECFVYGGVSAGGVAGDGCGGASASGSGGDGVSDGGCLGRSLSGAGTVCGGSGDCVVAECGGVGWEWVGGGDAVAGGGCAGGGECGGGDGYAGVCWGWVGEGALREGVNSKQLTANRQRQIPFGNDRKKSKNNGKGKSLGH